MSGPVAVVTFVLCLGLGIYALASVVRVLLGPEQ